MSTFYGISSDSVSTLFSSLGTKSSGGSTGNVLAEYASIKNGSYYKLTKAYYDKQADDKVEDGNKNKDSAKELTRMKGSADDVVKAADTLLKKGRTSLFNEEPEDRSEVLQGVKDLVDAYNTSIEYSKDANDTSVLVAASSMTGEVNVNRGLLGAVGVSVGSDNKMTVDEEAFNAAKWSDIKSLFSGNGSLSYMLKAKASYLSISAQNASTKTTTYNGSGYKSDFDYSSVIDDIV